MRGRRLDKPERPEIEIVASVKARELRFEQKPASKVRFSGHPERESVSGTEREGLPREVEPGVTYRNPRVRLRIASGLAEGDGVGAERVMDDVRAARSTERRRK